MNSRMLQHSLGKPGHHRRRIKEAHLNLSKHIPVPLQGQIPSKARGRRPVQSSCVHNPSYLSMFPLAPIAILT
jgi:hypothetical protein